MAITETVTGQKCSLLLNNGTSDSGQIKTVSVSLGTLSASGWDASKAHAIAQKLKNCLSKQLYSLQHVATTLVEDDET